MDHATPGSFRTALFETLRCGGQSEALKRSSLDGRLSEWTRAMTALAVGTCERLGWRASAKDHKLDLLPVPRSEYLGLDVVAFSAGNNRWRFPVAAMELENQQREDLIAYSLWKLLSVRTGLRVLFCYRRRPELAAALVQHLQREVIEAMDLAGRVQMEGETLLVIGSRSEAETFPYGFFHWWRLDINTGTFQKY